jgi:hypothetical protein
MTARGPYEHKGVYTPENLAKVEAANPKERDVRDGIRFGNYSAALDAISGDDPEAAHALADEVLLAAVPREVAEAYERLQGRAAWWATA